MKKILAIFFLITLPSVLKSQWIMQYNQGDEFLTSIQFFNENTGNVFGWNSGLNWGGYFFKTTTGGLNWDSMPLPSFMSTIFLYKQSFINSQTGYVCGFTNKIFKTTDGGLNWQYSLAPFSATGNQSYSAIYFLSAQTGYIGGRYGLNAKTTNGGINWITLDTALSDIASLDFVDYNFGFMGDNWSDVYKTTNGGLTWSHKYLKDSLSNEYSYIGIKFINYDTGYLIGSNLNSGVLFKTTNGGNNWKDVLIHQNNPFNSLFVVNGSILYIGCSSQRLILKSTNGGSNWTSQYLPVQSSYINTFFINPNTGYATSTGYIYKTTNGGVFINTIFSEVVDEYKLFQNYPNPFNSSTNLKYQIINNGYVSLKIFNIQGKEIVAPVNEKQNAGTYEVIFDASGLTSGIYFYKLTCGDFSETKKMLLIK